MRVFSSQFGLKSISIPVKVLLPWHCLLRLLVRALHDGFTVIYCGYDMKSGMVLFSWADCASRQCSGVFDVAPKSSEFPNDIALVNKSLSVIKAGTTVKWSVPLINANGL